MSAHRAMTKRMRGRVEDHAALKRRILEGVRAKKSTADSALIKRDCARTTRLRDGGSRTALE